MEQIELRDFGCFGKLEMSREFIVDGARALSGSGFDHWVGEGLALAKSRMGPEFRERATTFPLYRFAWGRDRSTSLAGVMIPSRDGAGRIHPFTVFGFVPRSASDPGAPAFAHQLRDLYARCAELTESGPGLGSPAGVTEALRRIVAVAMHSEDGKVPDYDLYMEQTKVGAFWESVLGDAQSPERFQILQALVETVSYLRGRGPGEIRLGIRFPLSPQGEQVDLEVAFWLDMTAQLLRRPLEGCCYFWTPGDAGALGSALYFFFSEPSAAQWSSLVDPDLDIETMSYLHRPYGERPEDRMDPALRRVLESEGGTLAECVRWAASS